jgi:hypothetical protein
MRMIKKTGYDVFEDAKDAAKVLKEREAQFLCGMYLKFQKERVGIQQRTKTLPDEPNRALTFILEEFSAREENMKILMDVYTDKHPIAYEMKKIKGIGPVIAAGYVAHVDMSRVNYFGQVLSYGGYSPSVVWKKGEKRPFNMSFRAVLIHAGRSFLFASGYPDSYFGAHYRMFKRMIEARNENGEYAEKAASKLEKYNIGKTTQAYSAYSKGKLPKGHIIALAKFKCVSLFVGIVHDHWSKQLGKPIFPYPFEYMGHDKIGYKTLEEVILFEERKRAEIKSLGDRKKVAFMEDYEVWKRELMSDLSEAEADRNERQQEIKDEDLYKDESE